MKKVLLSLVAAVLLIGCESNDVTIKNELRAPAYPLITIDPYTSGWSMSDVLYDTQVKHWTGKNFPLIGAIRVDGQVYRFMGTEDLNTMPILKSTEQGGAWDGKYTTDKPGNDWMNPAFNDKAWKEGKGAFGTKENEHLAQTQWGSEHIWVRRSFELSEDMAGKNVYVSCYHDDDLVLYVNGIKAVDTGNRTGKNRIVKLSDEAAASLKAGKNVVAAYCWNRGANGLIDFGLNVEVPMPKSLTQTAQQTSVNVLPTQTIYTFTAGAVDLKLTFTAPLLMNDLNLLSRPVNYISYDVTSNDEATHEVEIYLEASTAWALDIPTQDSESEKFDKDGLLYVKTGSKAQQILKKRGDDVRIDWGYFYLAAGQENTASAIGESSLMRNAFAQNGSVADDIPAAIDGQDNLSLSHSLGNVKKADGFFMLGYDDIYSIQYFGDNLRPYWNRNEDQTIFTQFNLANKEYNKLMKECAKFNTDMMKRAEKAGGKKYAEICALAYRQAITAHKIVEAKNGDLLFLSKENFSNGSIGTVDVTYPSAPLFLYYNVELAKGLLNHIFYYSEHEGWTKPFAAHDVGTYPLANGQTYGGDMPVEENGNMLALTAAIAAIEGNAKYAEKHWETLTIWTDYLVEKGLDPENQLCTDDFAGHFAHNVNLSVKAIMGVASYGRLADMLGKKEIAREYTNKAREMAVEWEKMANDGDHYRLTFDKPGSWSQKYNMVWDKILKMDIFPEGIRETEIAYYLTKQNQYGLPLDNREAYTKSDWIMWTATMANDKETFEKFINPMWDFYNETIDRVPMTDWYWTNSKNQRGFQARSVVGGYWIKMLADDLLK